MAYTTRPPAVDMAAYRRAAEAASSRYPAPADGHRRPYVAAANHAVKKTTPSAYDIACELDHRRAASYSTTPNTNSDYYSAAVHYRSQSHDTPSSGWHQDVRVAPSAEPMSAPLADRKVRRYGCLSADQGSVSLPPHLLASVYQRRSSESSTVSTASTASNADSPPAWSGSEPESEATTPGSASPISPNSSVLRLSASPSPERFSPPQRTSSKFNPVATAAAMSPSRPANPQQPSAPIRPMRQRAYSRPNNRFQNTPIESPVPEEAEEQAEVRHPSRAAASHAQQQQGQQRRVQQQEQGHHWQQQQQQRQQQQQPSFNDASAPSLHQRRQQRQQKMPSTAEQMSTRKPVPQTLSPLIPAPLRPLPPQQRHHAEPQQPQRSQQQRLKSSRSMPQLRNPAGPPPAMPLPPLPRTAAVSPCFPPTPASAPAAHPPAPLQPPPPPPPPEMSRQQEYSSRPTARMPLPTSSTERTLKASSTAATITPETVQKPAPVSQEEAQKKQAQSHSDAWEAEFQRQREFLKHYASPAPPPEAPREQGRLTLSRTYRSLGNLRGHSKAHSRSSSIGGQKPAHAVEVSRPSTAKSTREFSGGHWDDVPPMPALPGALPSNKDLPSLPLPVSVFEDDSDDEEDGNDTVRRFVRNLFSRRARSAEVHDAPAHLATAAAAPAPAARSASLGDAHAQHHHHHHSNSNSNYNANGYHNSRAKNQSTASSTLSMATTAGASTVGSCTGTPLTAQSSCSTDGYWGSSYQQPVSDSGEESPRASCERTASAAKGQHLLGRMFVRRSN